MKEKRGRCVYCGKAYALIKDGKARRHEVTAGRKASGSGPAHDLRRGRQAAVMCTA